jgi:hypothetical protein
VLPGTLEEPQRTGAEMCTRMSPFVAWAIRGAAWAQYLPKMLT